MKRVEYWFWMMTDDWGRRRKSPCRFTEADALRRDPTATRVPGSCEIRDCPESMAEWSDGGNRSRTAPWAGDPNVPVQERSGYKAP